MVNLSKVVRQVHHDHPELAALRQLTMVTLRSLLYKSQAALEQHADGAKVEIGQTSGVLRCAEYSAQR